MKGLFILSLLLNFTMPAISHADVITLRTDEWCPYACDPKSDKPGFMVEIANEVFKKYGHTVDYNVMNWARVLTDVKSGQYDGVIGASRSDVSGFVIPEVPTGVLVSYYYTRKDDSWMYTGVDSLKKKKIGVINDYTYGDEIDKLVAKKHSSFKKVSGQEPLARLVQMTETKRIDGFVENPLVLDIALKKLKKDKDLFKVASRNLANDPDLFIAFSPARPNSKEYARILDEGVNELRKSGRLKVILQKYDVTDWVK